MSINLIKTLIFTSVFTIDISIASASGTSLLPQNRVNINCDPGSNQAFMIKSVCYSFLTKEAAKKLDFSISSELETSSFVFEAKVDLGKNKTMEYLRVGYFSDAGKNGRFLMIASDQEFKNVLKIFHRYDGDVFSALSVKESAVSWYFCMNCADKEDVVFSNGSFFLE
ncbi:MAG TPA: hypothetical protein DCS87_16445 [Rheinheimera sp.]|nr:hypothetical protein [Rheinheimera sp.]